MNEPTDRQILYALVSGGLLATVAVLTIGAAISDLVPIWWTLVMSALLLTAAGWVGVRWRRTGEVTMVGVGSLLVWMIGTLMVAG